MSRKLLLIFLLAAATILPQNISGSGTYADPYMLYNAADVDSIRMYLFDYTGVGKKVHFELANDIDMSGTTFMHGTQKWWPLFVDDTDTVSFDGNGHWIRNMNVKWDTTTHPVTGTKILGAGLFGLWQQHFTTPNTNRVDTIQNINFDNVTIIWDSSKDGASSAPQPETGAGTLIGYLSEGANNGEGLYIHDIYVKNANIRFSTTNTNWISQGVVVGGIIGATGPIGASDGLIELERVGIDSSTIYAYHYQPAGYISVGGIIGWINNNGFFRLYESFISNTTVYFDVRAARYEFTGSVFLGLVAGSSSAVPNGTAISDIAVYNNTLTVNGILGGASDVEFAGGVFGDHGASNNTVLRTYVGATTFNKLNTTSEAPDNHGWFMGDKTNDTADSTNFVDTTGFALETPAWYGMYGEEAAAQTYPVQQKNAAQMIAGNSMYSAEGWDMINTWDLDPNIWDGYPYPLWARDFLVGSVIELHYPEGGEVFRADSSITVHWSLVPGEANAQYLSYTLDDGATYIPVDTLGVGVGDTSYVWTTPDVLSNQARFKVRTDVGGGIDSTLTFTILPYTSLNFLYPVQVTGATFFAGDTAHVLVESVFVDNFIFYYSLDSLTWQFLDSVVVDTVNMQYTDTTVYIWTFDGTIPGPNIWGRVTEYGDTALYGWNEEAVLLNPSYPVGSFICQYDDGGDLLKHYFHYDPSCGWASPPHIYYTRLMPDDGIGPAWQWFSEGFEHPYTGADHPEPVGVFLTYPADTLLTAFSDFYGAMGSTVTYRNRLYYVNEADSSLRCNDLINGINGLFVADLSEGFTGGAAQDRWSVGQPYQLQVYNVQWSKVSGEYLPYNMDFETLNDPFFEPKIMVSQDDGANSVLSVTALPTPIDPNFVTEDELLYVNVKMGRFYFRGIHPKAEKR